MNTLRPLVAHAESDKRSFAANQERKDKGNEFL
jgi:hypothetical protein